MGKVERMGSGIERMRELMRDAGLKEPVFEMDAFFRVTFYRDPRYSLKADKETAEKTMGKGLVEKGGEGTEKIRSKGVEPAKGAEKKGVDGLAEGLADTTQKKNPTKTKHTTQKKKQT